MTENELHRDVMQKMMRLGDYRRNVTLLVYHILDRDLTSLHKLSELVGQIPTIDDEMPNKYLESVAIRLTKTVLDGRVRTPQLTVSEATAADYCEADAAHCPCAQHAVDRRCSSCLDVRPPLD